MTVPSPARMVPPLKPPSGPLSPSASWMNIIPRGGRLLTSANWMPASRSRCAAAIVGGSSALSVVTIVPSTSDTTRRIGRVN